MITLEELYRAAAQYIDQAPRNWPAFMRAFHKAYCAHAIFYRVDFGPDQQVRDFHVIGSSDPATTDEYVKRKLYLQHQLKEGDYPNLEPQRRTDVMSDDEFRTYGEIIDFYRANGVFYMIMAPAKAAEDSYLAMVAWRSENEGDFDDTEKMRLGLFMRHLMAIVSAQEFLPHEPRRDILEFGARHGLTQAECEITEQLIEGATLKDIAARSGRSYGTIRWHVRNLLEKCEVSSQKNLVSEFYRLIRN